MKVMITSEKAKMVTPCVSEIRGFYRSKPKEKSQDRVETFE
tara:strand:+ start:2145 stop:2267 length:123 start_codon:yes stop_codon:yes gene_type:complete